MKALRRFTVRAHLPERLSALARLSINLRWSWDKPTQDLFEAIDPDLWAQAGQDPVALLGAVDPKRLDQLAKDQAQKKQEVMAQANADQKNYDALNYRDDQFDLSDALLAIAISMLAVASLTQLAWLYLLSLVPAGFGVLMGVAGLTGLHIHPDQLSALLS